MADEDLHLPKSADKISSLDSCGLFTDDYIPAATQGTLLIHPMVLSGFRPRLLPQRWDKLPAELKVQILNLVVSKIDRPICKDLFHVSLKYKALLCTLVNREMAAIATEIFYKDNTFAIEPSCYSVHRLPAVAPTILGRRYLAYPLPSTHKLVRTINVAIGLASREWRFLRKIADGSYGFENLKHVSVRVDWIHSKFDYGVDYGRLLPGVGQETMRMMWTFFSKEFIATEAVRFKCAGEVTFRRSFEFMIKQNPSASPDVMEEIENEVRNIIKFKRT